MLSSDVGIGTSPLQKQLLGPSGGILEGRKDLPHPQPRGGWWGLPGQALVVSPGHLSSQYAQLAMSLLGPCLSAPGRCQ